LQKPEKPFKIITTKQIIPNEDPFLFRKQYLQYKLVFDSTIRSIQIFITDKIANDPTQWSFAERVPIAEAEYFLAATRMFNDRQKNNIRKWMEKS
jgi:hypothetical protein